MLSENESMRNDSIEMDKVMWLNACCNLAGWVFFFSLLGGCIVDIGSKAIGFMG